MQVVYPSTLEHCGVFTSHRTDQSSLSCSTKSKEGPCGSDLNAPAAIYVGTICVNSLLAEEKELVVLQMILWKRIYKKIFQINIQNHLKIYIFCNYFGFVSFKQKCLC